MTKGAYGIVYQDIMRNPELARDAKLIYAYLASFAGAADTCYPSVETICRELDMSKSTMYKYMNILIDTGIVEKTQNYCGNLKSNVTYRITHEANKKPRLPKTSETEKTIPSDSEILGSRDTRNPDHSERNINNININNIKKNNNINNICPELEKQAPDPSGILLPLVDKTNYDVPLSKIELWKAAYPAVDVRQELYKMLAWLTANPTRKKTRSGIDKFINNWLSGEQDKGGRYRAVQQSAPKKTTAFNNMESRYYDFSNLESQLLGQ